jgi:hypothetical protein
VEDEKHYIDCTLIAIFEQENDLGGYQRSSHLKQTRQFHELPGKRLGINL